MQEKTAQHRRVAKRLKQNQARIALEIARDQKRRRSLETRKKVLLGALLMAWMDRQPKVRRQVERDLPGFLTRQIDRDVFGLPPAKTAAADSEVSAPCSPQPSTARSG